MNAYFSQPHTSLFYKEILQHLEHSGIPFLIGGAFGVFHYSGVFRNTKDLDVYCKPQDYPNLLRYFSDQGFQTQLTDVRWLAKVYGKNGAFIDIIFDTVNNMGKVADTWFDEAQVVSIFEQQVKVISAEELVRGKLYVQNRERFDGADINHIWLRYGRKMNWDKLLELVEPHWHLLLMQMLSFQFVYPFDYKNILPETLFKSLLDRAREQYELPDQMVRVCLGPLIDQTQYEVDIKKWNYKTYTIKTV